jgi:preprotein translocase subunit SecA
MKLLDKILRAGEGRRVKALQGLVAPINDREPEVEALSDDQLRARTAEFRTRIDNGADLDDLLIDAFATVREAARRTIGQRHYDVQLMGGAALHYGWVAEMKTGEGKTLVSTLPVYLNGLSGRGVHVVTVNDYLATRDAEWMGQIHRWLGLDVGLVVPTPSVHDPARRRAQYAADITYGTNNELGFDYLRDNMQLRREDMVQRGHVYAIVDEIDSILIDEARTPLIISGKVADAADIYYQFARIAQGLQRDVHYEVDEEKRQVAPTEEGIERVEELLGIDNLYDGVQQNLVHQLNVALRAKELFAKDKDYIVADGEVKIVDEFTGRILEGRRWSEGLHQAVEAKEGVRIKEENQTLATVTLQNYFRMYDKLAGMTGTAMSDAAELESTYGLQVVQIPTNKPMIRIDQPDLIYKTEAAKFEAVIDDLVERVERGQPVLVGTASVEKSEVLSKLMTKRGLRHEVLNAKQHFREAEIVAQAGQPAAITVATNMAGRGVDIILGGNAEKLAERDTKAEGLDPESDEGRQYYARRLAHWSPICKAEGDRVREAGGLYVLGTERHESRRIDDQLRGRSGRQGDPGESRFYLSLEDDLMRIFATGAMSWVMDRALPDDVPIESKMVTKSVERAQNTVEQRNAEIRKNVLKYDEVLNSQRKVIYRRRQQILDQGDLRDDAVRAIGEAAHSLVDTHCVEALEDTWDLEMLHTELATFWPTRLTVDDLAAVDNRAELAEKLAAEGLAIYEQREQELGAPVMRQIERQVMLRLIDQRWREHLHEMDHLRDGINLRAMGQKDPLIEWQREGFDLFSQMMTSLASDFVKYIMHVQLVAQPAALPGPAPDQAPVPEARDVTTSGPTDEAPRRSALARPVASAQTLATASQLSSAARGPGRQAETAVAEPLVRSEWEKTPRNAPCPCGSGKKYKFCHGR